MLIRTIFFILPSLLASCTVFYPKAHGPELNKLPGQYSLYSQQYQPPDKWWRTLESPELNRLIKEALSENFSIKESLAKLSQANISAQIAGAKEKPILTGGASKTYSEQKTATASKTSNRNWGLNLSTSYEVDLWGRLHADRQNALLKAEASAEDLHAAYMAVTGQIAETWINLIANNQQEKLIYHQLGLQKKLLDVIMTRFPNGHASALEVYQQSQSVKKLETSLIPLASKRENLLRKLAFLTGKATFDVVPTIPVQFAPLPPLPALGLPADLLAGRPDIKASGLRLQAAEWQVTAAKADRLPSLDLTAIYSSSTRSIDALFDSWLLNLAANVTGPIFDGDRRTFEVEKTQRIVDERLAQYKNIVFSAFKEVEDTLTDERQYRETLALIEEQLALSDKTMLEVQNRYLNGSSDFLNVLKEELNAIQLRQEKISGQENLRIARIRLHKALGGSWDTVTEPEKDKTHAAQQ